MESAAAPGTWRRLTQARGDARCTEDIEKDLHRNFPTHELFGGEYEKIGRAELYKVNGESTFCTYYCLRSRPVDPNVVRLFISLSVAMLNVKMISQILLF